MLKKILISLALLAGSTASAAPVYLPNGPQANVTITTVTAGGWTQCYQDFMGVFIGNAAQSVLNACQGDYLLMAGRETGSNTLLALAATTRPDTIIDTGNTSITHISNGSKWWFSDDWSWGFASVSDTVNNNECNIANSAPVSMCLHTVNGAGGYRINNITNLNNSTAYEKVFFVANDVDNGVPAPGVIAMLALGFLGIATTRRRV
jgi:hypothetical protein